MLFEVDRNLFILTVRRFLSNWQGSWIFLEVTLAGTLQPMFAIQYEMPTWMKVLDGHCDSGPKVIGQGFVMPSIRGNTCAR